MRRIKVFFISCMLFVLCVVGLAACKKGGKAEAVLLSATDTQVVIRVDDVEGNAVLVNALENLQGKGELTFTVSNGMVTAINGIENGKDYNPCWMIYTSDNEMASTEWGGVEYDGQLCGGAIVGVNELTVIKGGIYIFVYQGF